MVLHQASAAFRQTCIKNYCYYIFFVLIKQKFYSFLNKKSIAMKLIISKTFALVAIAATILSFTANFGGEGFEISLNGKIVLQQFGKDMDKIKTLQLNSASPNDKLTIRYHHCGQVGKNRLVTIKNADNNPLKVLRFTDVNTPVGDMSCTVKELLSLQKRRNGALKIFYSSSELPKGRQLVDVVFGDMVKK